MFESLNPDAKAQLNEQAKDHDGIETFAGLRNFFQTRNIDALRKQSGLSHALNESKIDELNKGNEIVSGYASWY